ncbi:uncharacterized protein H6S33_006269 [Morchella sextelata]|uniref:uncharacterized protein n=1 Tax=Morchella sextelata TaxID=1174677 RepID=UPI001D04A953|nr:uncharacterized protein H6S33_006269 [Morchella sextelata]KAH0604601.1 hypothetical protein H6S33_006269 [Morchella sextelata]
MTQSPPTSISDLQTLILTQPLIDNHAHNLLRSTHTSAAPLESITTEASGPALHDTLHTLSHHRAVKQLSTWLGCDPTWAAVKTHRATLDENEWAKKCFAGTQCILMDDGLDEDSVEPFAWHDQFTPSGTRRIVRIEKVAETILQKYCGELPEDPKEISSVGPEIFNKWATEFAAVMRAALNDPKVAGFKSVVCYRSGLDISPEETQAGPLMDAFAAVLRKARCAAGSGGFRIREKVFNDFLVREISRSITQHEEKKPLQFHTGLGDNDINLLKANPAHLQAFIKAYPEVPMVLLHSAYPYTQEAGYLASVYKNVYLDFGEVFPMISQDGQKTVIKQLFELAPTNKLLWSTDGHWFPETFALANSQMREVLSEVLVKRVIKGQITLEQAADITTKLLFDNSNTLYKLNLTPTDSTSYLPLATDSVAYAHPEVHLLNKFLSKNPKVRFFRLEWLDYTSTLRLRVVSVKQMNKMVEKRSYLEVTSASLSILQDDSPTDDFKHCGQLMVVPDWSSLRSCEGYAPGHASVMCFLRDKHPDHPDGAEVDICPRTVLSKAAHRAKDDHGVDFLLGIETEVVFLHRDPDGTHDLEPISGVHAWSTGRSLQNESMAILMECVEALESSGVEVLLFHPESADGQYEIVTGPLPPLASIDTLYHTRETIVHICAKYKIRATFHPKPFATRAGTAAHAHVSISPPTRENEEHFFGGVLESLRAVAALTMPNNASYERLLDTCWAGGTWVAWGDQNKEVPLRRCSKEDAHWEIKCIDGIANLYLTMAAVIGAGCLGLKAKTKLPGTGAKDDPSKMTSRERNGLGIVKKLPKDLGEALDALKEHKKLKEWVGVDAMEKYLIVKKGERALMETIPAEERREWMLERY